jgi:hypothetical protein
VTGVTGATGVKPAGQLFLSAAGMWPSATAGCAVNNKTESTTNDINIYTLDFDTTTQEHAEGGLVMPSDWNAGTITAQFYWTATGTSTNNVQWALQAVALGDLHTRLRQMRIRRPLCRCRSPGRPRRSRWLAPQPPESTWRSAYSAMSPTTPLPWMRC